MSVSFHSSSCGVRRSTSITQCLWGVHGWLVRLFGGLGFAEADRLRWRMALAFATLVRFLWLKFERVRTKHPLRLISLDRCADGWKSRKGMSSAARVITTKVANGLSICHTCPFALVEVRACSDEASASFDILEQRYGWLEEEKGYWH